MYTQVRRLGLGSRAIPYREAWDLQREIHEAVVSGELPPTLILLEHKSVFTAGRRTQPEDRPIDGSEVIEVDRGGRITWHGPGQLVGYPIVRLEHPMDVVAYVRRLEQLLIDTCDHFGVTGQRVEGRSGVWVTSPDPAVMDKKIAAIGVRVARGVTMHGFALNVNCSFEAYDRIVACGIPDAGITSLAEQTGTDVTVLEAADFVGMRVDRLAGRAAV